MRQRQVCASNMVGVEERRCREIRLAVVVVAVVQALGSAARADPPPTPACEKRCIDPKIRTLKGHTFIPPARFDTAFVTTHFGILLGGAYQKITPSAPANAPVLEVAGLSTALRFAARFTPWLGMFAAARGQVGVGINERAAFSRGGRAIGDWEVGLAGRILRLERSGTQIGVRLKGIGRHGYGVVPESVVADLLAAIIGQPTQRPTLDIVSTERSFGFAGALTAAQAINRHLGLQAALDGAVMKTSYGLQYGVGETGTDSTRFVFGTGIAVTADGMPIFPLGIMFEYRFRIRVEEAEWFETEDLGGANHIVGGGLFYTGRRALVLGVVAFWRRWAGEEETRDMVNAQLMMQYYF